MAIHPKDESLDPLLVPIMSVSTKALCSRPVDDTIQMLAETIAALW